MQRKFRTPILTTDGAIVERGKVLLVKRDVLPYRGYWVLPGGHVEYGEKVEKALFREIKEELGIKVKIKKLIGIYSNPKRDPRYHTVAAVYLCKKGEEKIQLDWEASDYKFFSFRNLPRKIGFDHRKILNDLKKTIWTKK